MTIGGPQLYLNDILESISQIEKYLEGITLDDFEEDLKTQDSVMRRLEIIGEAVKNLPDDFKQSHPAIPWRDIADFRNVLIHEYAGVKTDRVWEVVRRDLPVLRAQVFEYLKELDN